MRLFVALLLTVGFSTVASANDFNKSVRVNGVLTGLAYMTLNPDCSLVGYPSAKLVSAPSNGTVTVFKGAAFPVYESVNLRSACNRRRVPGTLVEYRPRRGFTGSDSFTVNVIYPAGYERNDTFNITVK